MSTVVRNRTNPRRAQQGARGRSRSLPASIPVSLPLLRTSERGTFRRCRWKWWLEFHELVKPQRDVPALRFGSLIHGALGAYYKPGIRRGPDPASTFERLYNEELAAVAAAASQDFSLPELDDAWSEYAELGIDMLTNYIERYGRDDEWKVLVTEYPFRTIVPHPRDGVTPWFYYVGVLDGVWESRRTKRKVIVDHKTAKAINLKYLQMDDQATSYWTWGVDSLIRNGLLAPDGSERLDGMLFNFLRKGKRWDKPTDPEGQVRNKPTKQNYIEAFKRSQGFNPKWKLDEMEAFAKQRKVEVHGDVSKVQPSPYHARVPIYRDWAERENARERVLQEFADIEAVRRGDLPHYKNPSQFTCNGCWAFDICELHEINQDYREVMQMTTKSWDPYAQHEIMEGR